MMVCSHRRSAGASSIEHLEVTADPLDAGVQAKTPRRLPARSSSGSERGNRQRGEGGGGDGQRRPGGQAGEQDPDPGRASLPDGGAERSVLFDFACWSSVHPSAASTDKRNEEGVSEAPLCHGGRENGPVAVQPQAFRG